MVSERASHLLRRLGAALRRQRGGDDRLVLVDVGNGRDADARRLDDVDGVDADARTDVARRRGVVPWHVGRDDDGDDAGPDPNAMALSPSHWQHRRDAAGSEFGVFETCLMERVITNTQLPFLRPTRRVLFAVAGFSAVIGALVIVLDESTLPFRIVRVVALICISLLVLAWCYFDSLERHQLFDSRFRVVILLFGLLALFIYLLKSRGLTQGMRSAGMALLFCAGMFGIMLASAFVFASIFGVE